MKTRVHLQEIGTGQRKFSIKNKENLIEEGRSAFQVQKVPLKEMDPIFKFLEGEDNK